MFLGCQKEDLVLVLFVAIFFASSCALTGKNNRPEVTISQGILRGKTLTTRYGRNVSAFLGIPYGRPPKGDLRFTAPVAAESWNGTRDASIDGNICPQAQYDEIVGDEDCLYINVYTPHEILSSCDPHIKVHECPKSTLFPVMVFFYGGGYVSGSFLPTSYGPEYILDKDVVLVVFNYRLGPLGFLSTGDEVASGNWGLKDQILALKWVQDNIAHFGGDPDQVTLFGQSAGGASIHLLSLTNVTIGLFHRYITQSGPALSSLAYLPRATCARHAFKLGEYVGCYNGTSDSLINCLRTVNISDIIAAYPKFHVWESYPFSVWTPTDELDMEGAVLTASPANLISAGHIRDLPWISGVTRNDGLLETAKFYVDDVLLSDFLENFDTLLPVFLMSSYAPDVVADFIEAVKLYYFNDNLTISNNVLLENLTRLVSDDFFYYPVYEAFQKQLELAVNPQYLYIFNYRGTFSNSYLETDSTANYGTAHSDDLIYLFPSEAKFSGINKTMSIMDYQMVDIMVELWTSFAINGTPSVSTSDRTTIWMPYLKEHNYLRIGNVSSVELNLEHSFFKERVQFWDSLKTTLKCGSRRNLRKRKNRPLDIRFRKRRKYSIPVC
ncbi:juvenile hormone esterase-like isoform X1 [Neodiprion pinetum]|uniref:juvenile hormone esterase-like isoform X1 n=1 Tax=Neodiprion pinetum TaxID=441929 RepID=UPI001EDE124A|nr:juvenile hormone esterase-like isoform X1 [Neodiprion pinetum]XP_046469051.1 juvenile hormone esterase-like isoform X1 [Neodiprion pinetum]